MGRRGLVSLPLTQMQAGRPRIHDLRYSFASNAVAQGMSLPMIGKLLGDTQVQTTARYAHLAAEDPLKSAAKCISTSILEAMGPAQKQQDCKSDLM